MSRILDKSFVWIPADDDSTAFRERQEARRLAEQGTPPTPPGNVTRIRLKPKRTPKLAGEAT